MYEPEKEIRSGKSKPIQPLFNQDVFNFEMGIKAGQWAMFNTVVSTVARSISVLLFLSNRSLETAAGEDVIGWNGR